MNTNDIIVASWQHAARHYGGEELPVEAILSTFGETVAYTASYLWPNENPEEIAEYYEAFQQKHMQSMVSLFPGIPELLRELNDRGYSVNMVTSRTAETLKAYMDQLELNGLFDVIITCDDVTEHKPGPGPIQRCIEMLEAKHGCTIAADECIMLGDSRFDIGCANNAGVDSVLVGWSHPIDEKQLEETGWIPTYRLDKPSDVWKVL